MIHYRHQQPYKVLNGLGEPVTIIVAAIGIITGLIGTAKKNRAIAKDLAKQRKEYEKATAIIEQDNSALDREIVYAKSTIDSVRRSLGLQGLNGGLGFCLINCGKKKVKAEAKKLNTAVDRYDAAVEAQNEKLYLIEDLKSTLESFLENKNNKYIILGLGGAIAVTAILVYATSGNKKKK